MTGLVAVVGDPEDWFSRVAAHIRKCHINVSVMGRYMVQNEFFCVENLGQSKWISKWHNKINVNCISSKCMFLTRFDLNPDVQPQEMACKYM